MRFGLQLGPNADSVKCSNGACAIDTCSPGYADCNGKYADGCECKSCKTSQDCIDGDLCTRDTCSNGGCFRSPPSGIPIGGRCYANCQCASGTCSMSPNWVCSNPIKQQTQTLMAFSVAATNCIEGTVDCGGSACVDINSDNENCGECGKACGEGQTCTNDECISSCSAGLANCEEACVDTQTDADNCGSCGNKCDDKNDCTGDTCSSGACLNNPLPDSSTCCSGTPVDTQADPDNCGSCSTKCNSDETCTNGECVSSCGAGLDNSGRTCANTLTDSNNCSVRKKIVQKA